MYGICGWEVRERSPRKRIMAGISETVQGHVNKSAGHKMSIYRISSRKLAARNG